MTNDNKLNDLTLEQVTGGAGTEVNPHENDYDRAWVQLNMDALQLSQMSRDEYYLEWKSQGFTPDAVDFLRTKM